MYTNYVLFSMLFKFAIKFKFKILWRSIDHIKVHQIGTREVDVEEVSHKLCSLGRNRPL